MYSIVCVYMHHICIYNVYVYIFVDYFQPLSLVFFINIIFDMVFYFEWTYSCNATRCQIVWEFKRIQSSVTFPNFPVDLVTPIHCAQDLTPKPKTHLIHLYLCVMVTGGDIIHAPCTCKCCIHVNDGCDCSLFKKRTKTNKKSLNPSVPASLLFWKEMIWSAVVVI